MWIQWSEVLRRIARKVQQGEATGSGRDQTTMMMNIVCELCGIWNCIKYQWSSIFNITMIYDYISELFQFVQSSSTLIRLWIQVITTFCPCFLVHLQALRCWNITSNILKLWLGQLIHLLVVLSLGRSAATTLGPWWSTLEVSSRSGFGGFDGVLLVNTHIDSRKMDSFG